MRRVIRVANHAALRRPGCGVPPLPPPEIPLEQAAIFEEWARPRRSDHLRITPSLDDDGTPGMANCAFRRRGERLLAILAKPADE